MLGAILADVQGAERRDGLFRGAALDGGEVQCAPFTLVIEGTNTTACEEGD